MVWEWQCICCWLWIGVEWLYYCTGSSEILMNNPLQKLVFTWKPLRGQWTVPGPRFGNPSTSFHHNLQLLKLCERVAVPALDEVSTGRLVCGVIESAGVTAERTGKQQQHDARGIRHTPYIHAVIRWWKSGTIGDIFHQWAVFYTFLLDQFWVRSLCVLVWIGPHWCHWSLIAAHRCSSDRALDHLWWSGVSSPLSAATKPSQRRRGGLRWVPTLTI